MSTSSSSGNLMGLTLLVSIPGTAPQEVFVQHGLSVGRANHNAVPVDDPAVDRVHAIVIKQADGSMILECQGSHTTITLGDGSSARLVKLTPGTVFKAGPAIFECREPRSPRVPEEFDSENDRRSYWEARCPFCNKRLPPPEADTTADCPSCSVKLAYLKSAGGFKGWLPRAVGPYKVRAFVAQGGMSVVVRGLHQQYDAPAAVKLVREADAERFEAEVSLLQQLRHPNVVRFQDSGVEQKLRWLAMDWVDGRPLNHSIQRAKGKPIDIEAIRVVLRQVVEGLAYLHKKNITHRDLKPGNILVGRDNLVKVADFGIAKRGFSSQDPTVTRTGAVVGTHIYMAPEVARGEPATPRSDIYSFGVIWYELLTGHVPAGAFSAPNMVRLGVAESWSTCVMDCLSPEQDQRPELSKILQVISGARHGPPPPPPPPPRPKLQHRWKTVGLTALGQFFTILAGFFLLAFLSDDMHDVGYIVFIAGPIVWLLITLIQFPLTFYMLRRPGRLRSSARMVSALLAGTLGAIIVFSAVLLVSDLIQLKFCDLNEYPNNWKDDSATLAIATMLGALSLLGQIALFIWYWRRGNGLAHVARTLLIVAGMAGIIGCAFIAMYYDLQVYLIDLNGWSAIAGILCGGIFIMLAGSGVAMKFLSKQIAERDTSLRRLDRAIWALGAVICLSLIWTFVSGASLPTLSMTSSIPLPSGDLLALSKDGTLVAIATNAESGSSSHAVVQIFSTATSEQQRVDTDTTTGRHVQSLKFWTVDGSFNCIWQPSDAEAFYDNNRFIEFEPSQNRLVEKNSTSNAVEKVAAVSSGARQAAMCESWIAVRDIDDSIAIYDAQSFERVTGITHVHSSSYSLPFLGWNGDGKKLCLFCSDTGVAIWRSSDWKLAYRNKRLAVYDVQAAFSPDGKYIAYGASLGDIELWNVSQSRLCGRYKGLGNIKAIDFSLDGKHLGVLSVPPASDSTERAFHMFDVP